jgi:hypothetical protein
MFHPTSLRQSGVDGISFTVYPGGYVKYRVLPHGRHATRHRPLPGTRLTSSAQPHAVAATCSPKPIGGRPCRRAGARSSAGCPTTPARLFRRHRRPCRCRPNFAPSCRSRRSRRPPHAHVVSVPNDAGPAAPVAVNATPGRLEAHTPIGWRSSDISSHRPCRRRPWAWSRGPPPIRAYRATPTMRLVFAMNMRWWAVK